VADTWNLLGYGADGGAQAPGQEPLDSLILDAGHIKVALVFLDHGADPNAQDKSRSTIALGIASDARRARENSSSASRASRPWHGRSNF
jgi:hypothetical protein